MQDSKVRDALRRRGIEPEPTPERSYPLTETEIMLAVDQPLSASAWDAWGRSAITDSYYPETEG